MSLLLKGKKTSTEFNKKDNDIKKWLRANAEKINVELINLTVGTVVYIDPKTKETITWVGSADVKMVSMDTLLSMFTNGKSLIYDFVLGIGDIYFNTKKTYEFKEVIDALGLANIYKPFDYDIANVDGVIISSTLDEFEHICKSLPVGAIERLAERFCLIRDAGQIDSRSKENTLTDIVGKLQMFRIIEDDE